MKMTIKEYDNLISRLNHGLWTSVNPYDEDVFNAINEILDDLEKKRNARSKVKKFVVRPSRQWCKLHWGEAE